MTHDLRIAPALATLKWPESLREAGEMGGRTLEFPWHTTALGPLETWPDSLRSVVGIMLASAFPSFLYVGPDLLMLYNDAGIVFLSEKHPNRALGLPFREVWSEVADLLLPVFEHVVNTGDAYEAIDALLPITRGGFSQECYVTFSYAPVRDEAGAISAVYICATETTASVVSARRDVLFRRFFALSTADSTDDVYLSAAKILAEHATDIPFAAFYDIDEDAEHARLIATSGMTADSSFFPTVMRSYEQNADNGWPIASFLNVAPQTVTNLAQRFADVPVGAWPEPPHTALIMPISGGEVRPTAFFILGASPRLLLNDSYRQFFTLVASQISTAVASVRALAFERRRALAFAAIDEAKTAFFANVSHEFRTPLTLMLGPLEQSLAQADLPDDIRHNLDLVQRNALRLYKLVNALLEVTRLESVGVDRKAQRTNISVLSRHVSSQFTQLFEQSQLTFAVVIEDNLYCEIEPDQWEIILNNLLSNAVKFTMTGGVSIRLVREGAEAVLRVSDTGIGIPEADLAKVFERFHRVQNVQARTHEGSGIGLALVHEITQRHAGIIGVESRLNEGTEFTARLPLATAPAADNAAVQLPPSAHSPLTSAAISEAQGWISQSDAPLARGMQATSQTTILVVDDNADMRDFITSLLASTYRVLTAADGRQALQIAHEFRPQLILTDVMMPVKDGIALLQSIRQDKLLGDTPVIVLSARAGSEASVQALDEGADDYVVKPFSAPEMLARVRANLHLAELRSTFRRTQIISDSFQDASLPASLPEIPGLVFDSLYVAGADDVHVGGDWYDAVRLADGRIVISIGDVSGSGLPAAIVMSNVRQIIRGIAQVHADPALMLDAADRAMRLEHPEIFVTAFVGVLDIVEKTLTYVSAGHPPALMRGPDLKVSQLSTGGLPIGLRGRTREISQCIPLQPGSMLLLYTDGLTEFRHDAEGGEREVERMLRESPSGAGSAKYLYESILRGEHCGDDIAIVTIDIQALPSTTELAAEYTAWCYSSENAAAAQAARRGFRDALVQRGMGEDDIANAELVFGELSSNVARYAPGDTEVTVDWLGVSPVLHFMERGPGFEHIPALPSDVYSETGRGLFIISALSDNFQVTRRFGGGSHARVILRNNRM